MILADAPLAEENLDKQVVPGCSCTLFCFADEVFTSSSQEQIVAARLASRPLLPTGVTEASERDGLGGEAAFSFDGIAEMGELSSISSENFLKVKVHELYVYVIKGSLQTTKKSFSNTHETTKLLKFDNIFSNQILKLKKKYFVT